MNQPTIKTAFKLVVAVIITFGLSLALQSVMAGYNGPVCSPPGCNVPEPINVGSSTNLVGQIKLDGLSIYNGRVVATSSGLSVAGDLIVNTSAFYVKLVGQNVGLGTTTPNSQLHLYRTAVTNAELDIQSVAGVNNHWGIYNQRSDNSLRFWRGSDVLTILNNGNVGIGVSNPGAKLEVNGNIKISGGSPGVGKVLQSTDALGNASWVATTSLGIGAGGGQWQLIGNNISYSAGNVGIGANNATSPGVKLLLQGSGVNETLRIANTNGYISFMNDAQTAYSGSLACQYVAGASNCALKAEGAGSYLALGAGSAYPIYIRDTGKVGIGTGITNPLSILHIKGSSPELSIQDTNSNSIPRIGFYNSLSSLYGGIGMNTDINANPVLDISTNGAYNIQFTPGQMLAMTIKTNRDVGIGTENPGARLEVSGGNFKMTNGFMAYVKTGIGCPPGDTVVGYRTAARTCIDAGGSCTTSYHDWSTSNSAVESCPYMTDSGNATCYADTYTLCNP